MRIKARMGMSLDGYVAAADGTPALITAGFFTPGRSHGYPGVPLWPRGTPLPALALHGEPRVFPDGSVELRYTTG